MIDLYTWSTPNGRKVSIMLEECELPYRCRPVSFAKKEQYAPGFLAINPNNKIPALVDTDGPGGKPLTLFESGAILWYLAAKTGRFLSADEAQRFHTLQWLMFQMSGAGPMLAQANHYRNQAPEKLPYAIDRFTAEAARLYKVVDAHLSDNRFLAGDYSVADIALYPWIVPHQMQGQRLKDFPHLARWFDEVSQRPAVQRGMNVPSVA